MAAIPKLHKLGIATKRPEDYFAEMVKTDDHMQRVCLSDNAGFPLLVQSQKFTYLMAHKNSHYF
jgi:hypothetical protein